MPLEPIFDHIDDLNPGNPIVDDPVNEGDNHLRGIKQALQGNVVGDALTTSLLVGLVAALTVDADGAIVVGQVKVSELLPLDPDDLTRKDYVDLFSIIAGAGLAGGGAVVGNPSIDVNVGNGIQIFGDAVTMSGSFAGDLLVNGDVRSTLLPTSPDDLTRKDYVDNTIDALQLVGDAGDDFRVQIGNVMILSGKQTAVGQNVNVTFSTPFNGTPHVVGTIFTTANSNNDWRIQTQSTTGFLAIVGPSGSGFNWIAIGQRNTV